MGGRSKGRVRRGKRELLQPNDLTRTTLIRQGAEYQVTSEYKTAEQDIWKIRSRVLRFVRMIEDGAG